MSGAFIRSQQDAETNAANRMRAMGFVDAAVTGQSADSGVDVRSSGALAQVNWRGSMVDRPELQNLFGARGFDHSKQLLCFAASSYSQQAFEYAEHCAIALFVYEPDGKLVSVNGLAEAHLRHSTWAHDAVPPHGLTSPVGVTTAKTSDVRGFWARSGWPFIRRHWRLILAIFCTIGIPVSIGQLISPDPGQTTGDSVGSLLLAVVGAAVFWPLYIADRRRKNSGAIPSAETARGGSTPGIAALWEQSLTRLNQVRGEYAAFETDPTQFFARPLLADLTHPAVQQFHDAFAAADSLRIDGQVPSDPILVRDFADRVTNAERAWRTADTLARQAGTSPFTTEQQALLRTAEKAITLALDVHASPHERAAAYSRVLHLFASAHITPPDSVVTVLRHEIEAVTRQSLPTRPPG